LHRGALLVLAGLLFAPCAVWPQGNPLGPEFRVNTYTTGDQGGPPSFSLDRPSITSDSAGNFVAVWTSSSQDGSSNGIFGQRYDASGAPLGPEFRVNTYTPLSQSHPDIAADASGNFVVVWQSDSQDGSIWGVFGQRYASSGVPLGADFRVNTFTTGEQAYPSVAADPTGGFVVAWRSYNQDGSGAGVFAQRFASSGSPLGPEFRVNMTTFGPQGFPSTASDGAGNFIVVWQGGTSIGGPTRRHSGSATPLPALRSGLSSESTTPHPVINSCRTWPRTPPGTSWSSGTRTTPSHPGPKTPSANASPAPARLSARNSA
jgi:hypothetical protein